MCLILQETCCWSLVLKLWRLDQETSEEKLFTKPGQITWQLPTDSYLSRFNESQQLSTDSYLSRITKSEFSNLIFGPC